MEETVITNKKMTLSDARYELEKHGFQIVVDPLHNDHVRQQHHHQQQQQQQPLLPVTQNLQQHHQQHHQSIDNDIHYDTNDDNNNNMTLVALKSRCHGFDIKLDTMIFVFQLHDNVVLTIDRINNDLVNYVEDKCNTMYMDMKGLSNTCPAQGCSRSRFILVLYYANNSNNTVDDDAMEYILSKPRRRFGKVTYLAVQDKDYNMTSFLKTCKPNCCIKDKSHSPEHLYWIKLLTGHVVPDKPPYPKYYENRTFQTVYFTMFGMMYYNGLGYTIFIGLIMLLYPITWCYQRRYQVWLSLVQFCSCIKRATKRRRNNGINDDIQHVSYTLLETEMNVEPNNV
jgi:hypothetical protein